MITGIVKEVVMVWMDKKPRDVAPNHVHYPTSNDVPSDAGCCRTILRDVGESVSAKDWRP